MDRVTRDEERLAYGRRLLAWRGRRGLTQPRAAALVPTSVVNYRKWERGEAMPADASRSRLDALMKDDGAPCS